MAAGEPTEGRSLHDRRILRAQAAAEAVAKLVRLCPDELLIVALHSAPLQQDPRPTSVVAASIRGWYAGAAKGFYHIIHRDLIRLRDTGVLELLLPRLASDDADAIIGALEDADVLVHRGTYFW